MKFDKTGQDIKNGHGVDFKCDIPPIVSKFYSHLRSQAGLGVALLNLTNEAFYDSIDISNLYVEHLQSTL